MMQLVLGFVLIIKMQFKNSEEIHIFWDKNSTGSLFDLGMAFASGKTLKIVNLEDVLPTDGKNFTNMIRYWSEQ